MRGAGTRTELGHARRPHCLSQTQNPGETPLLPNPQAPSTPLFLDPLLSRPQVSLRFLFNFFGEQVGVDETFVVERQRDMDDPSSTYTETVRGASMNSSLHT